MLSHATRTTSTVALVEMYDASDDKYLASGSATVSVISSGRTMSNGVAPKVAHSSVAASSGFTAHAAAPDPPVSFGKARAGVRALEAASHAHGTRAAAGFSSRGSSTRSRSTDWSAPQCDASPRAPCWASDG